MKSSLLKLRKKFYSKLYWGIYDTVTLFYRIKDYENRKTLYKMEDD